MNRVLYSLLKSFTDEKESYLSGELIGDELSITRAAVWKQVEALKAKGYEIDSSPKKGHRIIAFPDKTIIPELVKIYTDEIIPGREIPEIVYREEIGSTNTYAKELLLRGGKRELIVLTDHQVKGRGRLDRVWDNRKGEDIALTIVSAPMISAAMFYRFTMISALAVYDVLSRKIDGAKIKWPNDIYIGNRKICGILSEMVTEESLIRNMIIGIGINVNSAHPEGKSVSMQSVTGKPSDRNKIAAEIIAGYLVYCDQVNKDGFPDIYSEWKSHLAWLGNGVIIDTGKETIRGILRDVSPEGIVKLEIEGTLREFYSGDLMGIT
ncbi:MAG: biotin--[acetyl-CoA-carboxylase] ligase [Brevinematales bacterium]|nr:biotin--[acetyl-CoA-carboxylase] ligase [Brevinematales bacterium]